MDADTELDWLSLPMAPRFAGSGEQPRSPAPTLASWPPPPSRGSTFPPEPDAEWIDDELIDEV
jgi:hypothetical protein